MARTGRPRAFARDAALTTGMHLFWEHGYEGVSLDQLRRAMGGISSASFYAAFGSKEALYREALCQYIGTHGRVVEPLHDTTLSPRDRLEQALRRSAEMQTGSSHPAGCMVTLSSPICSENGASLRFVTAILACVEAGIADGTLHPQTNVPGLSALFDGLLLGLSIQARDGVTAGDIDASITQALKAWDAALV
jgi:AcrR family transcriptional regulator